MGSPFVLHIYISFFLIILEVATNAHCDEYRMKPNMDGFVSPQSSFTISKMSGQKLTALVLTTNVVLDLVLWRLHKPSDGAPYLLSSLFVFIGV